MTNTTKQAQMSDEEIRASFLEAHQGDEDYYERHGYEIRWAWRKALATKRDAGEADCKHERVTHEQGRWPYEDKYALVCMDCGHRRETGPAVASSAPPPIVPTQEVPMPEPAVIGPLKPANNIQGEFWNRKQMQAYGDARALAAMENAKNVCDTDIALNMNHFECWIAEEYSKRIRALIDAALPSKQEGE